MGMTESSCLKLPGEIDHNCRRRPQGTASSHLAEPIT